MCSQRQTFDLCCGTFLTGGKSLPRAADAHKRFSLAFAPNAHSKRVIWPHTHKGRLIITTVHKVGVLAQSSVGRKGNATRMLTQGLQSQSYG